MFEDPIQRAGRAAADEQAAHTTGFGQRAQYDPAMSGQAWAPAVDITEGKDAYLVAVDLPGVRSDDLEITFQDGVLTIQGQRQFTPDSSEERGK